MRALLVGLCLLAVAALADNEAFQKLEDELRRAEQSKNWRQAIQLNRRIIAEFPKEGYRTVESRRCDLGDSHFQLLELEQAEREYRLVMGPEPPGYLMDSTRTWAAYGLARIAAERRDFAQALKWLTAYTNAFGSGCGNCIEGRRAHGAMQKAVWEAAALSGPEAEAGLRRIIAGGFTPVQMRFSKIPDEAQREDAARAAKLALAEHYLVGADLARARPLLEEVAKTKGSEGDHAAAHLAQINGVRAPGSGK